MSIGESEYRMSDRTPRQKDATMMIRKLILATAAVMALSGGAQAANTITTMQSGNENNSSTVQSGPVATSNSATLVQMGFFNSGSVGQTGGNNTSTATQKGFSPTLEAARNVLTVGQNGINFSGTNSSTSTQTNSNTIAADFGVTPLNSLTITSINANVTSVTATQTTVP
jgi:hypothetical protein